jgi:CTP synthase
VLETVRHPRDTVRIAMVGKYVDLTDSYKSLNEALVHGGIANDSRVVIDHVDSERVQAEGIVDEIRNADAILVPMGFGPRGTEGKIEAVRFARETKVPFLGICFGMQMRQIEYARHVCGLERQSSEVDENTPHPVIALMATQRGKIRRVAPCARRSSLCARRQPQRRAS